MKKNAISNICWVKFLRSALFKWEKVDKMFEKDKMTQKMLKAIFTKPFKKVGTRTN